MAGGHMAMDHVPQMLTRSQQLGLLILLFLFIIYVFIRLA